MSDASAPMAIKEVLTVVQRFQELFDQTRYKEAAEFAAESPQWILRTPDTIAKFRNVLVQVGQTAPLLQYFATLLTKGKLNANESLELAFLVVNQNKKNLLENWLEEDKLECSDELGDLVKTVDNDLALKIYLKAGTTPEVVKSFAERKEFGKIPIYSRQVVQRFQELFDQTRYKEAAEFAAESPQWILRTPDTIAKFRNVLVQVGQTAPLLQYFATLLTKGKLNANESLELAFLVVNQNKKNLLENWLEEDKLECSDELGDLVKTVDNDLALKIYLKAGTTPEVVKSFAERKEFGKIHIYSRQAPPPQQHQVFVNFRGEQLRNNFVSHLVEALRRNEINVFIDYQEVRGEDISILLKRIEDSRIALVVFSTRYTESRWCLREAAKIKDCVEQGTLKVLPIFYKVTTSNVKQLKGEFGDHFRDREWEYRFDKPKVERWKEALAFISGKLGLTFDERSPESDFIELIVKEVLRLLASIDCTN